jgi:alpha-beta hydrolase superfamily lysophospholipase
MPFSYRASLWLAAHLLPGMKLTGEGLDVQASDNIPMLIALGRDPLVIKETRVDAVYGLVRLMDAADRAAAAPRAAVPLLILCGERDEIVPPDATRAFLKRLAEPYRVAAYPQGYHMLLRDLQAAVVYEDVLAWLDDHAAALPSGADGEPADGFLAAAEGTDGNP